MALSTTKGRRSIDHFRSWSETKPDSNQMEGISPVYDNDINWPPPPDWWDPRPAAVRYHRPSWRVLVFLIVVICGSALIWTGRGLETVVLTLASVGLTAATVAGWVADGGHLPSLPWIARPGGAE
jgi:hypothetical protein